MRAGTPDTVPARAPERSALLIISEDIDEALLERAARVAATLGAELEVYCAIVAPPASRSWITPQAPPALGELRPTRERGRRLACRVEALLNERAVGAHVEAGICPTVTEGILKAAARLEPGLVIYARPAETSRAREPHVVRHDELWAKLGVPAWVLSPVAPAGNGVLGLLVSTARSGSTRGADDRVASAVARVAARLQSNAYLLACQKRLPALAMVREVMTTSDTAGRPLPSERIARRLAELARDWEIPPQHAGLRQGGECDALDELLGPLGVGLVVASGLPRRRFGGLMRQYRARDLTALPCDLLVLGETGLPIFDSLHPLPQRSRKEVEVDAGR